MIEIRPTDDFENIKRLGVLAGLEPSSRTDGERLGLWGAFDGRRLAGGVALERLDGLVEVTWLWVAEEHRRSGIGSRLLEQLLCEARRLKLGTVWATARAPAFFLRHGFVVVLAGPERDLLLTPCNGCPQRDTSCRPEAVRRDLHW
jgi:N-acetylglutamate synthase-like GNAT family acetyltransferase